jgi:membrane protease YdiL (CAAX protease family)
MAQLIQTPSRQLPAKGQGKPTVEVLLAAIAVVLDLFILTITLLALAGISLAVRREGLSTLGFRRHPQPSRMAAAVFGLVVVWQLLTFGLVKPVLNHLTGTREDLSQFADLQGNLGLLAGLLLLTWTLAAVGEEVAYRGFILTRITDVLGPNLVGIAVAVGVSSLLFGLAHTEHGTVGVIVRAWMRCSSASCGCATAPCGRRSWPTASATPSGSSPSSSSDPSTDSGSHHGWRRRP